MLTTGRNECEKHRVEKRWFKQCCAYNGGWPTETAIQVEVSNHSKVL